jgi:HSP20 family protein
MLPTLANKYSFFDDPNEFIRRELGRFFRPVVAENGGTSSDLVGAYPVDIRETDDEIVVEAEVPGFEKSEIQVSLERGMLTITGERKAEDVQGEKHLTERRYLRIQRRFQLPATVDESQVDATLHNGVLTLTLEKKAEAKPRLIDIK